jgi:hypothetical protein
MRLEDTRVLIADDEVRNPFHFHFLCTIHTCSSLIDQESTEKPIPEQCLASSHLDSHCRQHLISELPQFFGYSEQLRRQVAKRESAGIPLFKLTNSNLFVQCASSRLRLRLLSEAFRSSCSLSSSRLLLVAVAGLVPNCCESTPPHQTQSTYTKGAILAAVNTR